MIRSSVAVWHSVKNATAEWISSVDCENSKMCNTQLGSSEDQLLPLSLLDIMICRYASTTEAELCVENLCQAIATSVLCLLLLIGGIYLLYSKQTRHFKTLLCFHNLRSASELILLVINTLEFARACTPVDIKLENGVVVMGPLALTNSILATAATIALIVYHRVVEIKKSSEFLYLSALLELALGTFRVYRVTVITRELVITELEPFLQAGAATLLMSLGALDSFTIYKERCKPKADLKEALPKNEKIGYKHSVSTFSSKVFFWWLTSLLWRGYHEPLEQEDLGDMREEDSAKLYYDQFLFIYKTSRQKEPSLWLCYLRSSWRMFTLGGVLKLLGDLSALVGPLSIHQIVEFIERQYKSKQFHQKQQIAHNNSSIAPKDYSGGDLANLLAGQDAKIYYPSWNELLSNGWVIAWLVLVASVAQGGLSQASTHLLNMTGIRIKTSLQGLIYRKTLLLSSSCLQEAEAQQAKGHSATHLSQKTCGGIRDAGAITNLMSEDALNIMSFFWIAHYVWAIPLKIGFVMYLLHLKLGISAIIGSFVCILTMTPLQFLIGKEMSSNSEATAQCTDERLRRTNDIFLGIKLIKLNAWEKVFQDKLLTARNKELRYLNKDSLYWTLMTFLTHISSVLITFVTLALYIKLEDGNASKYHPPFSNSNLNFTSHISQDATSGNWETAEVEFTASRLFTALALFNQLTVSLLIFPITVPIIISAIVSTRRLERFLQEPEVQKEFEGIRNMARILSKSDASLDMYEDDGKSASTSMEKRAKENVKKSFRTIECQEGISLDSAVSSVDNKVLADVKITCRDNSMPAKAGKDLIRNSRIEKTRTRSKILSSRESFHFQTSENITVSVQKAVFSWDNCNTLLKLDNILVPKGKLTVIVGKNGSGKSSLVAALLNEMQLISGEVIWNKYATIAYVPQVPWLLNSSIRENILFGESFRPKRYEKVLGACALKPDIELMPEGEMTVIGERGINLSGGQKQRIVIARALYSSANVVIMDDPFSSLDNEVARHVFENSIKSMLFRANRTVVLVTQRLQLLQSADYIIAMKDGYVQCAGTYEDIIRMHPGVVFEWNLITARGNERDQMSPGKTARERWRLFKNVSRIGLQRGQSADLDHMASNQSLCLQTRRRSSLFGSRHLVYEIPLPIDECQNDEIIIRKRPSRAAHSLSFRGGKKNVLRVNSLQPAIRAVRAPVVRNISSPVSFQDTSRFDETDTKSISGFRQFLHRMSSRKSNTAVGQRVHRTISASNSIQSISEESQPSLVRCGSANSSEYNDDDLSQEYSEGNNANFIYDEERKYGEIPIQIYLLYLKSCGLGIVLVFFIAAFVWQCLRVSMDVWLQIWTETPGAGDVLYYFNMYAIISSFCILMSIISIPAGQIAGCNARKSIYEHLLSSVLAKSLHFFQTTPLGRIINRFSNDMVIIDKKIAATSQRLLQFTLMCLCAVLINVSITPWFLLLTVPICGGYYIIQRFYRSSSRELQRIENITSSPVISHFAETIQGVTTIRAYGQESRFTETLFRRLEANTVAFIILNTSNRWLGVALDCLGGVIVFVAIITALITVSISCSGPDARNDSEPASPSAALVALAINYTLLIPIYLNWVVKLLADMEMYLGSVERVEYYSESRAQDQSLNPVIYQPVPISWPQRGDIVFEHVCCRYQGQKQSVITDLVLRIPAGQRIGVCGRTGSGKSSLALSLFGVLEVTQGRILIDDVDITRVHPDEVRSRLSIIPQDVYLFNATIRENLDPRGHYSDLELWNCLELAQLKDIVNGMPLGLDTEIVDGGSNLSVGHRQLFCLARAVLRGSVCLVLDEATSSLDSLTEEALMNAAHRAFQKRTILTIAHRLTTLLNYDRVIVLENGKIVEDGTPKQLQANLNGKFSTLLKSGNT